MTATFETVGRTQVCGDCGHLLAVHLPNGCMEVIPAGAEWHSCGCVTFMPLDAA